MLLLTAVVDRSDFHVPDFDLTASGIHDLEETKIPKILIKDVIIINDDILII